MLPRHYEVFYLNYGQINADEAAQVVVTALCHQIFVKRIPRPIYEFLLLRDKNLFSRATGVCSKQRLTAVAFSNLSPRKPLPRNF